MQHALGFAGGAAGVQDEKRLLGIERDRGAILARRLFEFVPPEVAALLPSHIFAGATNHDGLFDGGTILQCGVRGFFERNNFAAAITSIGGDQHFRFCVANAVDQSLRAKSAKNHRVHRADARARQHGDGQFGNHGKIDGDRVARFDANGLERIGECGRRAGEVRHR